MVRLIIFLSVILFVRLILFYTEEDKNQILKENPRINISLVTEIKESVRDVYLSALNPKDADLLMGIVFGENLDKTSKEKFIQTGVLHVVAASGMNVSMLTSFLLGTLVVFLKRQYAIILTSILILFYVALANFQPSIIRAAIMALFALSAGLVGRQNTSLLALFFTAFAMIFWDPGILVSVSFMLSFAATLGIILMNPILARGLFASSSFEDFRTTISAQASTTPILLFFFGTYSPISMLVNFLVLWTIPPLMVLGGTGAVLSFVSKALAMPFIYIALPLLSYFHAIVDFFARGAVLFELKDIPWAFITGYYLILLAGILYIQKTRKTRNASKSVGQ